MRQILHGRKSCYDPPASLYNQENYVLKMVMWILNEAYFAKVRKFAFKLSSTSINMVPNIGIRLMT